MRLFKSIKEWWYGPTKPEPLYPGKKIIYFDIDDTIAFLRKAHMRARKLNPSQKHPQSVPGFFRNLPTNPEAVRIIKKFMASNRFEVFFATAPSVKNPHSYTEKRLWVEDHFGTEGANRLIICPNKALLKGDILVDDKRDSHGQNLFEGELIQVCIYENSDSWTPTKYSWSDIDVRFFASLGHEPTQ